MFVGELFIECLSSTKTSAERNKSYFGLLFIGCLLRVKTPVGSHFSQYTLLFIECLSSTKTSGLKSAVWDGITVYWMLIKYKNTLFVHFGVMIFTVYWMLIKYKNITTAHHHRCASTVYWMLIKYKNIKRFLLNISTYTVYWMLIKSKNTYSSISVSRRKLFIGCLLRVKTSDGDDADDFLNCLLNAYQVQKHQKEAEAIQQVTVYWMLIKYKNIEGSAASARNHTLLNAY